MARQLGDSVKAYFWVGTPLTYSGTAPNYTLVKATHLAESGANQTLIADNASITVSDQGEDVDVTALGDTNRVYLAGKGQAGGRIDGWWNFNDNTLQPTMLRGVVGMLIWRPTTKVGDYEVVVPATILGWETGAQVNTGLAITWNWRAAGNLAVQKQTV